MAVTQDSPEVIKVLIEKGADLNLPDMEGNSPLHYTSYYNVQQNCFLLLENGANVNAQNKRGLTPLHVVCGVHMCTLELLAMLMYYGADVSIPSWNERGWGYTPFELSLIHGKVQFQHFLVDYVFDGDVKVPIVLRAMVGAIEHSSPLFLDIIDNISEIVFDIYELGHFLTRIAYFNPEYLCIFLRKFSYVLGAKSSVHNDRMQISICRYMKEKKDYQRVIDNLYVILQEPLVAYFVEDITKSDSYTVLSRLIQMGERLQAPLKPIEGIFFHILSYGGVLTNEVLDKIYYYFGECEFFRTLLFMDIGRVLAYTEWPPFPAIIYYVDLADINRYLYKLVPYGFIFHTLLGFFAGVHVKEACFRTKRADLVVKAKEARDVPSLLEFARNSSRNHIIKYYGISTSRQFCEVLKLLPLCESYRDIITFKRKIY